MEKNPECQGGAGGAEHHESGAAAEQAIESGLLAAMMGGGSLLRELERVGATFAEAGVSMPTAQETETFNASQENFVGPLKATWAEAFRLARDLARQGLGELAGKNTTNPWRFVSACAYAGLLSKPEAAQLHSHYFLLLIGGNVDKENNGEDLDLASFSKLWRKSHARALRGASLGDTYQERVANGIKHEARGLLQQEISMFLMEKRCKKQMEEMKARQEQVQAAFSSSNSGGSGGGKRRREEKRYVCTDWMVGKCNAANCPDAHAGNLQTLAFLNSKKMLGLSNSDLLELASNKGGDSA